MDDRVIIDDDSERITEPDKIIENDLVVLEDNKGQVQAFIKSNFSRSIDMKGKGEYRVFAYYGQLAFAIGTKDKQVHIMFTNINVGLWYLPLQFKCAIRHKQPLKEGFYRMDNGEIREYSGLGSYRYLHGTEWFPESGDTYDGKFVRMRLEAESEQESR